MTQQQGNNTFEKLESFFHIKYPNFIKEILKLTGFDSLYGLNTLDETTIKEIEEEVNKSILNNDGIIENIVKNTVYEKKLSEISDENPFKFLIGHKSILLNIKKDVEKYTKTKKLDIFKDTDTLKHSLLKKIEKYLISKNYKSTVEIEHISKLSAKENWAKCYVKCSFCEVETPCTFDGCWRTSNFYKHLSSHYTSTELEVEQEVEEHNLETISEHQLQNQVNDQPHNQSHSQLDIERATINPELFEILAFVNADQGPNIW